MNKYLTIFPHLHLLVSGGNSQLILFEDWSNWKIVGQTLDDAAGESFDKIGRMLGYSYPAGVSLSKVAKLHEELYFELPESMKNDSLNFSFSGLKTACRYFISSQPNELITYEKSLDEQELKNLFDTTKIQELNSEKLKFITKMSISVQFLIVNQLVKKLNLAVRRFCPNSIGLSGGVSANLLLQNKFLEAAKNNNVKNIFIPNKKLTGDNAIMIGLAGLSDLINK